MEERGGVGEGARRDDPGGARGAGFERGVGGVDGGRGGEGRDGRGREEGCAVEARLAVDVGWCVEGGAGERVGGADVDGDCGGFVDGG